MVRRCLWIPLLCCCFILRSANAATTAPGYVTSYNRMVAELQADCAKSPDIRMAVIGKSATGSRSLWLVRLSESPSTPLRYLIIDRQHGDEPASTEAMLRLIDRVAAGSDPSLIAALKRVTLYIVPMANPDGADAGTRVNGVGADLNRDWGVFAQPETRAIRDAVKRLRPQVVIDQHNWDGTDLYNANCVEASREPDSVSSQLSRRVQEQAVAALTNDGYLVHPTAYGADADPRLAHRYFTAQGIASLLVETHSGDPQDTGDFQRRQGMYTSLVRNLVLNGAEMSGNDIAQWDDLEHIPSDGVSDAAVFPLQPRLPNSPPHPAGTVRAAKLPWLLVLCVYGLAVWAMLICRWVAENNGKDPEKASPRKSTAPVLGVGNRYPSTTKPRAVKTPIQAAAKPEKPVSVIDTVRPGPSVSAPASFRRNERAPSLASPRPIAAAPAKWSPIMTASARPITPFVNNPR